MFVQIKGGQDAAKVTRKLKEAGNKTVAREFNKGLRKAAEPITAEIKKNPAKYVPDRYAKELGPSLKGQIRQRAGKNPQVRLLVTAKTKQGKSRNLGSLDAGRLRKPVFGNRKVWVNQRVKPGFASKPFKAAARNGRKEMQRVIKEIEKSF